MSLGLFAFEEISYLSTFVEAEENTAFSEFDAVKMGEGRMKNQYEKLFSFNTSVVWQDHYTFYFHFSLSQLNAELSIYSWRGGGFIPFLHHIIHSEIHF